MKRLLLITLLLLSSGPVYAEWVLLNQNDQTGLTVYVVQTPFAAKGIW